MTLDGSSQAWLEFWQWLLTIGIGAFFLIVVFVVPLGFRDILRLFRHLDNARDAEQAKRDKAL